MGPTNERAGHSLEIECPNCEQLLMFSKVIIAVLCCKEFVDLKHREGITPSMMEWAIELEIDEKSHIVTNKTFGGVIVHAYNVLRKNAEKKGEQWQPYWDETLEPKKETESDG